MAYTFEVFSHQYPVVVFFMQHLGYYRGLQGRTASLMGHREFWASTTNGHLKLATLAWCNIFGSRAEDLHWTKTPAGDIVPQAQQDFRNMVLAKTGFTKEQWEAYRKEMVDLRGKYVAHLDLYEPFDRPLPLFDPALQVAYAYQEWVRELIRPILLNQPTLSSLYEQCRAEASSIICSGH